MKIKKIGFIVSYYSPKYVRAITLRRALGKINDLEILDAWNENPNIFRYFETFKKIINLKKQNDLTHWIINFRGHDYYWPLKLILGKKSVTIFDQFVSPYDSYVHERQKVTPNSIIAKTLYKIEKSILNDADILLTDTKTQAKFFSNLFQVPLEKFFAVNMSVDEAVFTPSIEPKKFHFEEKFIVFTYATFLPLHGMMTIARSAKDLRDLPIRFIIAGGKSKALKEFLQYLSVNDMTNINHIPWIEPKELPSYICGADLCLGGPFGGTPQAKRIVTGKTLQFLACERPTIIGKNSESTDFVDRKNCLLVNQGDSIDLANAIRWAYHNTKKLMNISKLGKEVYEQKFSINVMTNKIRGFLSQL